MTYKELTEEYRKINELVDERRITEAFEVMENLIMLSQNADFTNRFSNFRETYRNILAYTFEKGDDPEKEQVFNRLIKSVLELADEVKEEIIMQNGMLAHYKIMERQKRESEIKTEELSLWIETLVVGREVESEEESIDTGISEDKEREEGDTRSRLSDFFKVFWLNNRLTESHLKLIGKVRNSPGFPWYYRSLLVSALTLSVLRYFDIEKIRILFDIYEDQEHRVWQRALVGILIGFYVHDNRLNLYPEIEQRIKILQGNRQWNKAIESVVIQLLRAKETEKVTEKIRNEIMPELWKMRSTLEDKLNIEDLLKDKMLEDKNPEWERVFEDTPDLYDKMEEFSNLQMEGSDVFLSAFAMLKNFEFFNDINNWFLPFYKENYYFADTFSEVKEGFDSGAFLEGLERTGFLCNSDKYSFCLNVKHMPDMQKTMMVELFNMEMQAMNEMASEDELLKKDVHDRSVIVQYIQDLYRFFRLHPLKKEFKDIFELPLDFHNRAFFRKMVDDEEIIRNIAEFYFEKDHYEEALNIFLSLEDKDTEHELLEKVAYSYQCLGKFEDALDYYKRAEIVTKPRTWLYNKIAFCYRRLGKFDLAIKYYEESEKIDAENLYIQTSLGQANMEKEDYETALQYFFKVEYLAPDNIKVHRPIAWCSFVLGKTENAKKYFEKIVQKEGNKYDYMNLGHVYWSLGDKAGAIENYRISLEKAKIDHEWFREVMKEDSMHLMKYQLSEFDISLMIDYIKLTVVGGG